MYCTCTKFRKGIIFIESNILQYTFTDIGLCISKAKITTQNPNSVSNKTVCPL